MLVEAARQGLGRALVRPLLSDDGGPARAHARSQIEEELSRAFNPQAPPATGTGLQPLVCSPHSFAASSMACASWRESR